MRVSDLGEFGLLRELEQRGLTAPIPDDAAVLRDGLVLTQDTLLEGIHFRLEWTSWRDLGYKAAAVNLSDLAAMGAEPEALLLSLGLRRETETEDVFAFYEGLNEPGVPVVGGDTTAAASVSITVAAAGRSVRWPGRAGAQPGDLLVVTGPLGGAAAGLEALRRGLSGFEELVRAFNRPPYRLDAARVLAPVAHAMIDLSDGIASDAARIAERSRCKLVIEVGRLPLFPRIDEVADVPFWTLGEDYELLAALAPDDARKSGFPVVGYCAEGSGAELLRNGEPIDVAGWDHFRR